MQEAPENFIDAETARVAWLKSLDTSDGKRFMPSGFKSQDREVGPFERGSLNTIGSTTGAGKTSWLFGVGHRMATREATKVFYYNLEMTVPAMWNRLACIVDPSLKLTDFRSNVPFTAAQIQYFTDLSQRLKNFSPLFCEDSDIRTLISKCLAHIPRNSDSVLMVDYFALLSVRGSDSDNRWNAQAECAKQLKLLATQLNIPIITAVQFNSGFEEKREKNKNAIPSMTDFRGDKEIAHHSNVVLAMTRDNRNRMDIYCLKNRNGATGMFSLEFVPERASVEDWGD